ncbi:MAG TPA: hypothetical protein VMJ12_03835 [Candidatus Acidoferrales bacterium]|nr:hypothetical protein [Candidatus Acidoferrales bacterium]
MPMAGKCLNSIESQPEADPTGSGKTLISIGQFRPVKWHENRVTLHPYRWSGFKLYEQKAEKMNNYQRLIMLGWGGILILIIVLFVKKALSS